MSAVNLLHDRLDVHVEALLDSVRMATSPVSEPHPENVEENENGMRQFRPLRRPKPIEECHLLRFYGPRTSSVIEITTPEWSE